MGKVGGVLVTICGVILFLVGLVFLWGILASNMLVMFAGQYIIIALILLGAGVFLMYKGVKMYNRPKNVPSYDEYMRKYPND